PTAFVATAVEPAVRTASPSMARAAEDAPRLTMHDGRRFRAAGPPGPRRGSPRSPPAGPPAPPARSGPWADPTRASCGSGRRAMRPRGDAADDDERDAVTVERGDRALGVERRAPGRLRRRA